MRIGTYLGVNGVLEGDRSSSDAFELPAEPNIFRSARFGKHMLCVKKDIVTIFPLKREEGLFASVFVAGAERARRARGHDVVGSSVSKEDIWRGFVSKISNVLVGYKAHAASFFW